MDRLQILLLILSKFKGINKLSVPPEIIKKTYDFLMISEDNEVN